MYNNIKINLICIIIFIIFVAILTSYNKAHATEQFNTTNAAAMIYTTSQDNISSWINKVIKGKIQVTEIDPAAWDNFKNTADNNAKSLYPNGSSLYICDPYDYDHDFSKFKIAGTGIKGYFIGIATPEKGFNMTCSLDILDKTIGYLDHSDLYFIKAIIDGYRMDKSRIKLVQLKKYDFSKLIYTLNSTVDFIITYVIPGSPYSDKIQSQPVAIMGFGNLDWERVRLFYPYTVKETVPQLSQIFSANSGVNAFVSSNEENTFLPAMSLNIVTLYDTNNPPVINEEDVFTEPFVTRLNNDDSYYDPSYRCYGNLDIDNKALCDSPYDVIGLPKLRYSIWDQPCFVDTDCPYYQADKKRGGCMSGGVCEFPVGVKGLGYRKNINTGQFAPFCYDCPDPYNTTCCHKNSDLAFPDDSDSRKKAGQKLTLPLI